MELKSIEYKLTVCKVADISEIDWLIFILLGKPTKKYRWYAKLKIRQIRQQNGMTDGEAFAFREFWIFH